jgi:hypothetical protein
VGEAGSQGGGCGHDHRARPAWRRPVRATSVEGDRHGQPVWRTNGLRPVQASSVEETGGPRRARQRRPASMWRQCAGTYGWWGPRDTGLQAATGGVVHAAVAGGVVHAAPACMWCWRVGSSVVGIHAAAGSGVRAVAGKHARWAVNQN